ncbi:hypothetical protein SPW_7327 [Streptomyces sp. W007]|uniref:hypothetical protein n=1 Tax=Streptomyces sp. W007 TaxID=1055352 RepID=UPI000241A76E|nr:hypothetical protein [Streptomyces sp. W007]EHM24233.1 hypothetical protein SPW_7327 [Streptomyces sp. W007]
MSFDYSKPPGTPRSRARYLADERQRQAQGAMVVVTCVVLIAAIPIQAFILMLVMGAAHGAFISVPAIGYGTSVLFVLGANLLAGFTRRLFRK